MKNTQTFITTAILFLFSATVFFSCGGKKQEANTGKIKLVLASGAIGAELQENRQKAARFMQLHPDISVEVLDSPDLSTDRLGLFMQTFAAQSDAIDVLQLDVIWPGDLKEHLVDLNVYGGAQQSQMHFPAIIKNNTVDGKLLAMPLFTDGGMLYYRTDLLVKYGFERPPATWQELKKIAKIVQEGERKEGNKDFWGFLWQGNAFEGLTCDALEWVNGNGGGSIIESDGTISIDNANAAQAIDMATAWIDDISPTAVLGYGEEDTRMIFQSGNAMFMRNWPYAYKVAQAKDSAVSGKFDVSPPPAGKSHVASALGGWELAVSKYSKHPREAAELVFFMTGKEEQKITALTIGNNPTIMELYQDQEILKAIPYLQALYNTFQGSVARPSTVTSPNYSQVSRVFFLNVHEALSGKISGEDAVKTAAMDIKKVLAKNK